MRCIEPGVTTGVMTVIRDMTAADLDPVSLLAEQLVLLHHSWDTTRFVTTPDIAKGYRRYFESQLGEEGVVLLTAEVDSVIAGYLFGTLEKRDWAKLLDAHGAVHDVFVASTARRHGVAQALMDEAKARFRALGAKQVVLYSASSNAEGQALFKRLGYRPTMVEMTLDLPSPR
jgi:ribosomal protein S18 acetylase RimI-like enzyme